jgi:hypothetical protein
MIPKPFSLESVETSAAGEFREDALEFARAA